MMQYVKMTQQKLYELVKYWRQMSTSKVKVEPCSSENWIAAEGNSWALIWIVEGK